MSEQSSTPAPSASPATSGGRRSRVAPRRRFDVTTVLAVVVPLVALGLAFLVDVGPDAGPQSSQGPAQTPLTRASLVCPGPASGDRSGPGSEVVVASTSGTSGTVSVSGRRRERDVDVAPGTTTGTDVGPDAAVVTGVDDLAPGLVAGRFDEPLASYDCRPPVFDQWFTGVGAGARHRSTLQLVNPDSGTAVVDVVVLGRDGPVAAPQLRGIAVSGGQTRQIELAEDLPRRDELALHVTGVRGRVSASVLDTVRGIATARTGDDALASQEAPSTSNLLLGLPGGSGVRTLVLANPGDSEGRATVRLVTSDSVFAPADAEEIDLPPQSVVRVSLTGLLADAGSGAERPIGLQVDASVAVTATLSMFAQGDLLGLVPVPPLDTGTSMLPAGDKQLVLGAATQQGVVRVSAWDADGEPLPDERVEVAAGRAADLELPDDARLVTVAASGTSVTAVVVVTGDEGATVVRLREPVTSGLVADVRPGPT